MHFSNEGSVLQLQRKRFIILWTGRNIIEKVINNVDIQFFRLNIWSGQTFLRIWHFYFYIQISSRKYELDVFFDVINRQWSQLCDVISWFMISWYKIECGCAYHLPSWFEKRSDIYQILNMTKCNDILAVKGYIKFFRYLPFKCGIKLEFVYGTSYLDIFFGISYLLLNRVRVISCF